MKYCSNCGKELKEGADICLNCGKIVSEEVKTKKEGKGKSIASMILGIIAVLWAMIMLVSLDVSLETLFEIGSDYYYQGSAFIFGYYIGYSLFALTPGIIGLVLGIKGNNQKENGMAKAGIITSSIALGVCLITLIRFLVSMALV